MFKRCKEVPLHYIPTLGCYTATYKSVMVTQALDNINNRNLLYKIKGF